MDIQSSATFRASSTIRGQSEQSHDEGSFDASFFEGSDFEVKLKPNQPFGGSPKK